MSGTPSTGLVLAGDELRQRLREVQAALDERRDAIASLDLSIEDLLTELADFEHAAQGRLAREHDALGRVEALVRHLERWGELMESASPERLVQRGRRLEVRRHAEAASQREVRRRLEAEGGPAPDPGPEAEAEVQAEAPVPTAAVAAARADRATRLKQAYRALARRFHPDLARTERERVAAGKMMARVNDLYRLEDLDRLEALAEQAKGGEVELPDLPDAEQVDLLQERLAWYDTVYENLREERARIEDSPTCELMRRHEAMRAAGGDLFEEMRAQLHARWLETFRDVPRAAKELEAAVSGYNRRYATVRALTPDRRAGALERLFDPEGGQTLARLVLDELELDRRDPKVREAAVRLEALAAAEPARLRLVLLAWVSELSPFPLPGLQRWDDVAERFRTLGAADAGGLTLEEALARDGDVVEWGVRQATAQVAQVGLHLRDRLLPKAVPLALQRGAVRRIFKQVLRVLTERTRCETCRIPVFPIPLYRSRGIDDLRGVVCPHCGTTLARYWMPKGDDVQSLLNQAYLDLEIVSEWGVRIGRSRIATQLLPVEVEAMTLGDLKRRVYDDLFARYELPLRRGQLQLHQGGERVRESTPLPALHDTEFDAVFDPGAEVTEAEAAELLRHRARHKFERG